MERRRLSLGILLAVAASALLAPVAGHAQAIAAQDAGSYVGQTATVCGVVASARFATRSKAQPTFLNLDQPYPRQVFTVVIFGDDRQKFGQPEVAFKGKRVCAVGRVEMYRGKPEIILHDPAQLRPDDGRTEGARDPRSTLVPAQTDDP
jgi:DNA/RNA endonuclease YhcR with UshA esterase domain